MILIKKKYYKQLINKTKNNFIIRKEKTFKTITF